MDIIDCQIDKKLPDLLFYRENRRKDYCNNNNSTAFTFAIIAKKFLAEYVLIISSCFFNNVTFIHTIFGRFRLRLSLKIKEL